MISTQKSKRFNGMYHATIKLMLLGPLMLISVLCNAQVIFKNSGWSKLSIAIGYYDISTGWTTKGWYNLEPGEEKPLYNYNNFSNPNFYYCSKIDHCDKGYFGETSMYVDIQNAFAIHNANKPANYASTLIQPYKFRAVNLKGLTKYTIELKPINLICGGLKQGKWRLGLDKEGDLAQKAEDEVYSREVTFENGQPVGWCKDYYSDGKLKGEFKLKSIQPLVFDGKCTWYKPNGNVEKEVVYKDGMPVDEVLYQNGTEAQKRKAHYETVSLPVQNFYINSTSNETWKGGNSKVVYPVQLPEGTVEWYYEFTASRDKVQAEANTRKFSLASQLSSLIDKTGLLSATVNMFTAPPGGNDCNVYLLDRKNYDPFINGQPFNYNIAGSRQNYSSGIVQVRGLVDRAPMIGVKNPDGYNGINVSVQVVAVISKLD
jgi:antitoxin component YwqK of YwqJK toxin-antitoxin module/uncharacterized membrane protein